MKTKRSRPLSRQLGVALGMVVALLAITASPAAAQANNTLFIGQGWTFANPDPDDPPGVHEHTGVPYQAPDPSTGTNACARYTSHYYEAKADTGGTNPGVEVGPSEEFDGEAAVKVSSLPGTVYDAGPDGTYHAELVPTPGCIDKASLGDPIGGFRTEISGVDTDGDVLACVGGATAPDVPGPDPVPGSDKGVFTRDALHITFAFYDAECTIERPGTALLQLVLMDITYELDIITPAPAFPWNTACNFPIAPTTCLSTGTVHFAPAT